MADEKSRESVIAKIDRLVADLDRRQLQGDYVARASMPWATVVEQWDAFATFIQSLDRAIKHPFAVESVHALRTGEALHGHDVYRLAFALVHVATAIGGPRLPRVSALLGRSARP
jgi:hypothetical protein